MNPEEESKTIPMPGTDNASPEIPDAAIPSTEPQIPEAPDAAQESPAAEAAQESPAAEAVQESSVAEAAQESPAAEAVQESSAAEAVQESSAAEAQTGATEAPQNPGAQYQTGQTWQNSYTQYGSPQQPYPNSGMPYQAGQPNYQGSNAQGFVQGYQNPGMNGAAQSYQNTGMNGAAQGYQNTGMNGAAQGYQNAGMNGTAQGYQNPNMQYRTGAGYQNPGMNGAAQGYQNPGASGAAQGYQNAGMNGAAQGYQNPNMQYRTGAGYQNPGMNGGAAQGFTQGFQNMAGGNQNYQNPNAQYAKQQQGYQNPYYVNPSFAPGAVPAKKSKKKIWIPILIVVLLAAIGVGAYFLFFRKHHDPETAVTEAMTNTFTGGGNSLEAEYLGQKELTAMQESGSYESRFEVNITELNGSFGTEYDEYLPMLAGLGISSSASIDLDAQRFAESGSIQYDGTSYLDYQYYAYDDYIALACPDLFEGYLEVKTSNFGEDFNHSPLAEALGETIDPSFAFRFFDLFSTQPDVDVTIPDELQTFMDEIRFEAGEKESIELDGRTQSCQSYRIVIPRESIEKLAKWFCSYLTELGTPAEYSDIEEILPDDDMVCNIYVDKKGRMVRFSFDQALTADGETLELICTIDFTGADDPADHVTGEIKAVLNGYAYGISFDSVTNETAASSTTNTKADINVSGISVVNLEYASTFDTATGGGHMDLSVSAMYQTLLSLAADYRYSDVVSGKSYTINIDELSLDIMGELTMKANASYSLAPLSGPVEEPSGTKYDLFTLTEEDTEALLTEIAENLMEGPLGSLLYAGYGSLDTDDWNDDSWDDDWEEDWDNDDWY